jgi:hypothetical protein
MKVKIKIRRSMIIDGRNVKAGEIAEVDMKFARDQIKMGRAEEYKEPKKPKTTNRSVGLKKSEPEVEVETRESGD